MYRISLGIVIYHNKDEIVRLLDSIQAHCDLKECQAVVLDNCSKDGTAEYVEQTYPWVQVLRSSENKGFGNGHNQILKVVDSQYHVIVNPDICLLEDTPSLLADYLDKNTQVTMVTPRILSDDGTEQRLPQRNPRVRYLLGGRLERFGGPFARWRAEYTRAAGPEGEPRQVDFCTGCFSMIRTEVFKKLGGFDEQFFMYFEDADLTRRAQVFGETVFYPKTSVVHSWERASAKSGHFFRIQLSSMIKYFKKWARNAPLRCL